MPRRRAKPPKSGKPRAHDSGYKLLFTHREMVADLITGYLDPRLCASFDLSTLERCNGSYVSPDLRERRNDVVWRVQTSFGMVYVYLLLEFQSSVERYMAVRLLGYTALLWQDLIAQKQLATDGMLPPVLPIVLYNGDLPWTAPRSLRSLIAPGPAALRALQPTAQYVFLDENRVPTGPGMALRNLSAALFALEQSPDLDGQHAVVVALRGWLADRPDLRQAFGTWIAESLAPSGLIAQVKTRRMSLDEVEPMMATRLKLDIERKMAASRAEGEAQGEAKGAAKGAAKGEAKGRIETIRELVRSGSLTIDAARSHVRALQKSRQISAATAKSALTLLG